MKKLNVEITSELYLLLLVSSVQNRKNIAYSTSCNFCTSLLSCAISWLHHKSKMWLQCSSDISEPKYTRNTHQPNTRIRVWIYAYPRIRIRTYAYVLIRVCLISMYELTCWFFLLTGHCCIQWLDSLQQSESFLLFWIRVYSIAGFHLSCDQT